MKLKLGALILAHALDGVSTCHALARGYVELNPLLPASCAANVTAQAGWTAVQVAAVASLNHHHPKAAGWIVSAIVAGEVAIAVHNWRLK